MIAIGKTQESLTNYLTQLNKQLASINESISTSLPFTKNHCLKVEKALTQNFNAS